MMKQTIFGLIALTLLFSCVSDVDATLRAKQMVADNHAFCSFENFTWEDTGEYAHAWTGVLLSFNAATIAIFDKLENWHLAQCGGRDAEPLKCNVDMYPRGSFNPRIRLVCLTENGDLEDYRVLTGLISEG